MADTTNDNTPINGEFKMPAKYDEQNSQWRNLIGIAVIFLVSAVLISLIIMAWCYMSWSNETFGHIKELLAIVLPLIGTWMGTVLAFYFSKENFEAANRSLTEMVKQVTSTDEKLQELKVKDVMLKPNDFALKIVKDKDEFEKLNLKELIDFMEQTHSERVPILQADTLKFIFLIYRSTIERFLIAYSDNKVALNDKSTPETVTLIMNDMLNSNFQLIKDIKELTENTTFLPLTATLSEVRIKMQDNTICQDVFITKTGSKDEGVEGWITNEIVTEKSELFKKAGPKN